jgi:hypothetical protein
MNEEIEARVSREHHLDNIIKNRHLLDLYYRTATIYRNILK